MNRTCLWIALLLFAAAAVLRLLVCLKVIDLRQPFDQVLVAAGLAFLTGAFLVHP